jgi:SAM-dependent methyltransferase
VVPLVLSLIQPRRVIDVGCGLGSWLSIFREFGVDDILGLDGDYVNPKELQIPAERFVTADLTQPLLITERFDLAVSLEVAEHLPAQSASTFVDSLTRLSPIVLFSAAIPYQSGTHHVNEQWPDYWLEHFERNGFDVIDCIRRQIWSNPNVEWWYAQNILLFARHDYLQQHSALQQESMKTARSQLSIVHPGKYMALARVQSIALLEDLSAHITPEDPFILVDQETIRGELTRWQEVLAFPEVDGTYGGLPPDGVAAAAELDRLRRSGADFIVFIGACFWWLETYPELERRLRAGFRCVLENDWVIIFDLRHEIHDASGYSVQSEVVQPPSQ